MANLIDRFRAYLGREKSFNQGPPGPAGPSGIPISWPSNWFQYGWKPPTQTGGAVVEACVSAYAQTVAQLPGRHYEIDERGVKTYNTTSRLARVLAQPNDYQTSSDFLLNVVYSLLLNGNAYWFGNRVGNEKPLSIHLLDPSVTSAERVRSTGDVYYSTSGDFFDMAVDDPTMNEGRMMIPERFIGHIKLHTPQDPLVGVTPLANAAASVATHDAITGNSASFYNNMSRPSGFLSTDMDLSKDQMTQLRDAWQERSTDLNSGGMPILGSGMKWNPLSLTSQDAQMIEAWRMTVEDISRVFRVPPMLINNMDKSTFDNAETLMRFWLSSGLGFLINHIEQAMGLYYGLDARKEGVEYDTEVLLRADMQARLEALGVGVTKGVYSPNEARKREGLAPVDGGDMPRVQQQMVPLDWEQPDASPATPALPAPEPETIEDEELAFLEYLIRGKQHA